MATEHSRYVRGGVDIALTVMGRTPRGQDIDEIMRTVRATLDVIPLEHLSIFGDNSYVRVGSVPDTGGGHRPRRVGSSAYIRLSYACFTESYNQGGLSYTLLHEMGHIVDKSVESTCMDQLVDTFPLGALGIITRYHGGATQGLSEHFSDVYADYFYNEVQGLPYRVNRGDPGWRCGRRDCVSWTNRLQTAVERAGLSLPRSSLALTTLRYDALFHTAPFENITRAGVVPQPQVPAPADVSPVITAAARGSARSLLYGNPVGRLPSVLCGSAWRNPSVEFPSIHTLFAPDDDYCEDCCGDHDDADDTSQS